MDQLSLRPESIPAVTAYPSKRSDPARNIFLKHFGRLHIKPYCFLIPFLSANLIYSFTIFFSELLAKLVILNIVMLLVCIIYALTQVPQFLYPMIRNRRGFSYV